MKGGSRWVECGAVVGWRGGRVELAGWFWGRWVSGLLSSGLMDDFSGVDSLLGCLDDWVDEFGWLAGCKGGCRFSGFDA